MGISIWQILIVVLIVVVLFGAGRIPRLMGDMAKGIKSFKACLLYTSPSPRDPE